jgi:LTXXQ motif family protein
MMRSAPVGRSSSGFSSPSSHGIQRSYSQGIQRSYSHGIQRSHGTHYVGRSGTRSLSRADRTLSSRHDRVNTATRRLERSTTGSNLADRKTTGSSLVDRKTTGSSLVDRKTATGSVRGHDQVKALRNNTYASLSNRHGPKQALASSNFQSKFTKNKTWFANHNKWQDHNGKWHDHGGWHWRHNHPIIAAGWYGPLFWPYAYWDFIDYTYWPYAYDEFWPYAYDDVYVGIFGPYAYEGPDYYDEDTYPAPARRHGRSRTARRSSTSSTVAAVVCGERAPQLTGWPIQQIAQTVQPDQTQQAALNDLRDATAKAIDVLQASCPDDLPSIPTGRLTAMRKRVETMLQAVNIVQPPLQRFYDALSDEQKSRFNAIGPDSQAQASASDNNPPTDLSQMCSGEAVKAADMPIDRIEKAINPNEAQRSALRALSAANSMAADHLKANCSQDQTLTPPGHVAAMQQRLNAMLEAIKTVQPALETFYGSLSDEQKARFNQLGVGQG